MPRIEKMTSDSDGYYTSLKITLKKLKKEKRKLFPTKSLEDIILKQRINTPLYPTNPKAYSVRGHRVLSSSFPTVAEHTEEAASEYKTNAETNIAWKKYKTQTLVNNDKDFVDAIKVIITTSIKSMLDPIYKDDKNLFAELASDALNLSSIPEDAEAAGIGDDDYREGVRGLIEDVSMLINVADMAEKYYGVKLYQTPIDKKRLFQLNIQDEFVPEDYDIIFDFLREMQNKLLDGGEAEIVVKTPSPNSSNAKENLLDRVEKLPNSLEKYELSEFFYNSLNIIRSSAINFEDEYKVEVMELLRDINTPAVNRFMEKLEIIQSIYPEVGAPHMVAEEIHWSACEQAIIPYVRDSKIPDISENNIIDEVNSVSQYPVEVRRSLSNFTKEMISEAINDISKRISGNDPSEYADLLYVISKYDEQRDTVDILSHQINRAKTIQNSCSYQKALYDHYITNRGPEKSTDLYVRRSLLEKGFGHN